MTTTTTIVAPYNNDNPQFVNLSQGKTRYLLDRFPTLSTNNNNNSLAENNDVENHLVVCVHGIGSYSYTWHFLSEHILSSASSALVVNDSINTNDDCDENDKKKKSNKKMSVQVLRYDLYGRGLSDDPPVNHDAPLFVDQLFELLSALEFVDKQKKDGDDDTTAYRSNNVRITLLGHSMGGGIAVAFAEKYPDLIDRLVLITAACTPFSLPFGAGLLKVSRLGEWIYGAKNYLSDARSAIRQEFYDSAASERGIEWILKHKDMVDQQKSSASFLNSFRNFPLQGLSDALVRVGQLFAEKRVLIVWAMYDTTVPPTDCFMEFWKAFPSRTNHQFIIMANCRHTLHQERTDDMNTIVSNFVLGGENNDMDRLIRNVKVVDNWAECEMLDQNRDRKYRNFWEQFDKDHSASDKNRYRIV